MLFGYDSETLQFAKDIAESYYFMHNLCYDEITDYVNIY